MAKEANLDAVTLWIYERGIAHILESAEPLRARCGKDAWRKAAVTAAKPSRVCADCRLNFALFPHRRPTLPGVERVYERQLAFGVDWAKLKEDP